MIQVGRRQPRAGAAGRWRPRSPGLTAAKCRTGPCHDGRAGGLWANSEAASVSNSKGGWGVKKVNLHLTPGKMGFVILASESALSSTTLLKRPNNLFFTSHFSTSMGVKPTELYMHITLYLVLLPQLAALRRPPPQGSRDTAPPHRGGRDTAPTPPAPSIPRTAPGAAASGAPREAPPDPPRGPQGSRPPGPPRRGRARGGTAVRVELSASRKPTARAPPPPRAAPAPVPAPRRPAPAGRCRPPMFLTHTHTETHIDTHGRRRFLRGAGLRRAEQRRFLPPTHRYRGWVRGGAGGAEGPDGGGVPRLGPPPAAAALCVAAGEGWSGTSEPEPPLGGSPSPAGRGPGSVLGAGGKSAASPAARHIAGG